MNQPIICFGQQPCGFFPKRFLIAKINTARKLQKEIGGKIVFFYHDSDADYRETITIMKDLQTGASVRLNFTQENKLQKKFSPLYLKRIPANWQAETLKQLPRFTTKPLTNLFASINEKFVSNFCLEMYKKMGLLDTIDIVNSSDKNFRNSAITLTLNYFVDIKYQDEIVRAKNENNQLSLHEGGGVYTYLPKTNNIQKMQISPNAHERFLWMNSYINCTHYIYGEGEKEYLKFNDFPKVTFIKRSEINDPEYAWMQTNL